jgi:uncharacterized repeat protein (TIGR04052 family)
MEGVYQMKSSKNLVLAVLAASISMLSSVAHAGNVELKFAAEINGAPFTCGQQYSAIGTTSSTVTPSDFRYFISAVSLINSAGVAVPVTLEQDGMWQYQNLALLDFEDGSGPCINGNSALNNAVKGSVQDGDYKGVQFTLGVPFEMNHLDVIVAPSPLNLSAMFWNWQGGHRFLKVDMATSGRPVPEQTQPRASMTMAMRAEGGSMMQQRSAMGSDEEEAAGFAVHLGSTGCAAASRTTAPTATCANPNLITVVFDDFDISTDVVVADIGKVLAQTNVDVNTDDTAPGCMSGLRDPECSAILKAFGFSVNGEAVIAQQLFSVK